MTMLPQLRGTDQEMVLLLLSPGPLPWLMTTRQHMSMTFLSVIQSETPLLDLCYHHYSKKQMLTAYACQSGEWKYILYCTSGFPTMHPFLGDRCIKHPVCRLEFAIFLVCSKASTGGDE